LQAIGEALSENGRFIVTGCLARARSRTVNAWCAVSIQRAGGDRTARHEQVLEAVHAHLPRPHEPFADLIPPAGVKLTPPHYAYLKIARAATRAARSA